MTQVETGASTFEVGAVKVRVVTNCAVDISAAVRAERNVVRKLVDRGLWPHETVTLFVLDDLAPLAGHLRERGGVMDEAALRLPQRPMVNVYDPRHPVECFIFVNRQMMVAEGYWDDAVATEGLLAHEHAHPLSEARATAAARILGVEADGPEALRPLAVQLGKTLSVGAVSELLANAFCIANGFADELAHVDRITLDRAAANLSQRGELERRVRAAVAAGNLPPQNAGTLLLLADAQIGLPFALEVAPFATTGHRTLFGELDARLVGRVLSGMAAPLLPLYRTVQATYVALDGNWGAAAVESWCADILATLSTHLSDAGAPLTLRLVSGPRTEGDDR
ncbi:hypothetical protein [Segnochrobactrum spirostomi]|uniref:Uncharacterized protein n=1 Tax=Segnochrobactrum spirostomi TaxID=2608987 RepID=A0A6A7Y9X8_9HYPH|nr:hypothetical protein [Segnochrobactrum spirostomi]MQT14771.1 hypothetical protein [Segnochrobactrum spirostomi]